MVASEELQKRISFLLVCMILVPLGMIIVDSIGYEIGNMDLWQWMITHSFVAIIAYHFGGGQITKI